MKSFLKIFLIICFFLPLSTSADGCMIPPEYDPRDIYEPSQTALIVYDNNKEDLYLQVNYEGGVNDFVWIVPTPNLPEAETASKNIFKELSIFTNMDSNIYSGNLDDAMPQATKEGVDVIVHSQENIGIYEVTVLSSSGTDALFDWLQNNKYAVTEEIKETLNWYVEKEWYFTAVRVDRAGLFKRAVAKMQEINSKTSASTFLHDLSAGWMDAIHSDSLKDFQKYFEIFSIAVNDESIVDRYEIIYKNEFAELVKEFEFFSSSELSEQKNSFEQELKDLDFYEEAKLEIFFDRYHKENAEATRENFYSKFADDFVDSLKNKDYAKFSNIQDNYMVDIWGESKAVENEQEFLAEIAEMEMEGYTDDWQEVKEAIIDEFEYDFSVGKGAEGEIEPIKISFENTYIVYPMKISSFSTKEDGVNEVLLYVMTDKEIYAPGFELEYTGGISEKIIDEEQNYLYSSLSNLRELVGDKSYKLTKIRREFAKVEMDQDLYLVERTGNDFTEQFATERDAIRIDHIKFYQTLLELYYNDNGEYPENLNKLVENEFIEELYNNPTPGGKSYEYNKTEDGYELKFSLEMGTQAYGKGKCVTLGEAKTGMGKIECEEEYQENEGSETLSESYSNDDRFAELVKKKGNAMADRLKGKIVIKVEDEGKAYYINPKNKYKYFLGYPDDAFNVMRNLGMGISNRDIEKIEIGSFVVTGTDDDGDGLSDMIEDAIGTDPNNPDTDGDGYGDKEELQNGYSPKEKLGGKTKYDVNFSENQKGKILLQVENNGEAWYVNPGDGKRYFLGRPYDAFNVMRDLGLGITNEDFDKL